MKIVSRSLPSSLSFLVEADYTTGGTFAELPHLCQSCVKIVVPEFQPSGYGIEPFGGDLNRPVNPFFQERLCRPI